MLVLGGFGMVQASRAGDFELLLKILHELDLRTPGLQPDYSLGAFECSLLFATEAFAHNFVPHAVVPLPGLGVDYVAIRGNALTSLEEHPLNALGFATRLCLDQFDEPESPQVVPGEFFKLKELSDALRELRMWYSEVTLIGSPFDGFNVSWWLGYAFTKPIEVRPQVAR